MKAGKSAPPQAAHVVPQAETNEVVNVATLAGPVAPSLPIISDEVTRAAASPILINPGVVPDMPSAPAAEAAILASANSEFEDTGSGGQVVAQTPNNFECEVGFTAMAAPGAMVDLTLEAPCYREQMVDIFHAGLRFTEKLDENGLMQVTLPAMEENAFFNAFFTDGQTESTDVLMLTVKDYQRTALFWKAGAGFSLYALEDGSVYGGEGHVSPQTPFEPLRATAGEGGFLTLLGQGKAGYQVAIYSYPEMLLDTHSAPEISVEAEVQAENCGREISATLTRSTDTGALEIAPLFLTVPGCETIGEYLVLKNLPQKQTIAAK